jgi:poly-beta-hydroxyalkanoate depolymerase
LASAVLELKLLNAVDMSNAQVEGGNYVSLNAFVESLQRSHNSYYTELSKDDFQEVDYLQYAYDNLFENNYDMTNLNKNVAIILLFFFLALGDLISIANGSSADERS